MKRSLLLTGLMALTVSYWVGCQPSTQEETPSTPPKQEDQAKAAAPALSEDSIVAQVIQLGRAAAQATFKTLGAEVVRAIRDKGPEGAITYCNTRANPLIDSISKQLGVRIRRVSHRPRNPANSANAAERELIAQYIEQLKEGQQAEPVVVKTDSGYIFYAPIVIQKPLCLTCHGVVGRELSEQLHAVIKQHYPTDSAYNFRMGDVRGLWKIFVPEERLKS